MTYVIFFNYLFIIFCVFCSVEHYDEFDDKILYILRQIRGLDIYNFELPSEFEKSDDKDKIKTIFKKENMKEYNYKLDDIQLKLIDKINQLRRQKNIQELKYNIWNCPFI